ncbi:Hypothetical protein PFCIRM119_07130 [Propionibacterium freudenreichii]|uniref:hypothetical protein n=1 Tax=Propionibacterium freudenreichii TaxID=1744 RepID=UPI000541E1D3|nr:hypothetical protein [Propionibacterium freudenreichii]MCT3018539.1 hypothetical protein [Propionibacterium freudenreichii]CEG88349.1 Hypothetical protein PFCIRM119_07130 [Propionibacterium freudenreichii]
MQKKKREDPNGPEFIRTITARPSGKEKFGLFPADITETVARGYPDGSLQLLTINSYQGSIFLGPQGPTITITKKGITS